MKQVLRESLILLSGGQYLSLIDEREIRNEFSLNYAELQALRPKFQASSWRGAIAKSQERGWIQKRSVSGKITFQLTKVGRQVLQADFVPLRQFLRTQSLSFLLVHLSASARSKAQDIRDLLQLGSGNLLIPGLWVFPTESIPDILLEQVRHLGAHCLVIPARSSSFGKHFGLSEWPGFSQSERLRSTVLSLEELSKRSVELLDKSKLKKRMHHLQIAQLGDISIQVLLQLKETPWVFLENQQLSESVFQALETLDILFTRWKQSTDGDFS